MIIKIPAVRPHRGHTDVFCFDVSYEIKLRINVAVAAYAYEFKSDPIMSDAEYDRLCRQINVSVMTGRPTEDKFFATEFDPSTSQWVHCHPDLDGLDRVYNIKKNHPSKRVIDNCRNCRKPVNINPLNGGCHC